MSLSDPSSSACASIPRWDCLIGSPTRSPARDVLVPEETLEERVHSTVEVQPSLVKERLVRVVRVHDELIVDVASAQQVDESDRLREVDVAIVVVVPDEHG